MSPSYVTFLWALCTSFQSSASHALSLWSSGSWLSVCAHLVRPSPPLSLPLQPVPGERDPRDSMRRRNVRDAGPHGYAGDLGMDPSASPLPLSTAACRAAMP